MKHLYNEIQFISPYIVAHVAPCFVPECTLCGHRTNSCCHSRQLIVASLPMALLIIHAMSHISSMYGDLFHHAPSLEIEN